MSDQIDRPHTPFPEDIMEINLRTPSILYNHGGYYAPGDPHMCNNPGGICENCQERIDEMDAAEALAKLCRPEFMEPCPSCGNQESYITHASQGLRTCNGCEDKFCTNCYYGSRYCCTYVYLPSPPHPLSRQCSEEKWRMAEDHLRTNPEETIAIADHHPGRHIYRVVRTDTGELVRQHESLADK